MSSPARFRNHLARLACVAVLVSSPGFVSADDGQGFRLLTQSTSCDGTACDAIAGCDGLPCNGGACSDDFCCLAKLFDPERERCLPILGKEARFAGYDIPLPYGVGGNLAYIDQAMDIGQISLGVGGAPATPLDEIPPFQIQSRDTNVSSRFDVWLFPFLNVYGLYGHTSGNAIGDVTVSGVPGLLPDTVIPVSIDYDGPTYGGGLTGALGYKSFFAALDWNYTTTDLDGVDNGIVAQTASPRFGLQNGKAAAWVGAFFMDTDKELTSTVDVDGTPVLLKVDLEVASAWNFIYGVRLLPCENFEFVVEHGFGIRNQVIGAATLRF